MKTLLLCVLFFVSFHGLVTAQKQALQITNTSNGKYHIIKENRRVRLKTYQGEKYSGRVRFLNSDTLIVRSHVIALKDIKKLKRNPLLMSIVINGTFYYTAAVCIGGGLLMGAILHDASYLTLLLPGVASMAIGVLGPNPIPAYHHTNWEYEVIQLE